MQTKLTFIIDSNLIQLLVSIIYLLSQRSSADFLEFLSKRRNLKNLKISVKISRKSK